MKPLSLVLMVSLLPLIPSPIQRQTSDIVFINGNIYTVNDRQAHAEAIAVKHGRIIYVGSSADVKAYEGPARASSICTVTRLCRG
jgi:adenine deaminase